MTICQSAPTHGAVHRFDRASDAMKALHSLGVEETIHPALANRQANLTDGVCTFRLEIPANDPSELVEGFENLAGVHRRSFFKRGYDKPKLMSLIEMNTETKPLETIIDDLLRRRDVMGFIGATKSYKSWNLHCLVVCLAAGRKWLKWGIGKRRRVLLIDNELKIADLLHRFRCICAANGHRVRGNPGLHHDLAAAWVN